MSVDATKWAWSLSMPATRKIVLLSMADRAGETHACWPSIARLEADTCLDRKTILAAIADLESMGLITVSRSLGQGNCYQLVGVNSRETSPNNGTASSKKPVPKTVLEPVPKTGPVPISGPVPKTEPHPYQKRDTHQYQKRDTEPTIEPTKNLNTTNLSSAREISGSFAMSANWQPSEYIATLVKQAGMVMPGQDDFKPAVVEFIGFWLGQPTTRTQQEWDHALIKNLKAQKLRSAFSPSTRTARQPRQVESFKERDDRKARERWEQMTGEVHPDNLPKQAANVIDITPQFLEISQ